MSVRLKLTLSYAAFLMLAGALLLAAVWLFLLRYVPEHAFIVPGSTGSTPLHVFPVRSNLLHVFAPRAAAVLAFLLLFGLLGGWILAGRMLAPSHALLLQLSTNLVHNAIVHNLPAHGTVRVTTSAHPNNVVLTVENTG